MGRVVGLEPLEARAVGVELPQRLVAAVDAVEVLDEVVHPVVQRLLQQPPVEAAALAPLRLLPELAAHEEQLLAGVAPQVGEEGAQRRHLVDARAAGLAQQRALAVHDLVVADRQHEVLVERVHQREGQLAVVVPAVDGLLAEVLQRVVHPAHVPLEAEAEAALVGGLRDPRPRRRLLGDHDDATDPLVGGAVGLLEQLDGLEVLATAVLVGDPGPGVPGVVEVEHRGHAVDAQAVDVELLEPVEGVGDEEVAHLGPAVVEDVGAPLRVPAEPGVGVLVEGQSVEACERPLVGGEVAGHPVEQDADAGPVQLVDEVAEVVGPPPPRARGVVAGHVVAPRRHVGVLHDRQELDVGEAQVTDVVDEVLREAVVAGVLTPGAEVHLVDAHRTLVDVGGASLLHPVVVAPRVVRLGDDGRLLRRDLRHAGHRVALEADQLVGPAHGELVVHPFLRSRAGRAPRCRWRRARASGACGGPSR